VLGDPYLTLLREPTVGFGAGFGSIEAGDTLRMMGTGKRTA